MTNIKGLLKIIESLGPNWYENYLRSKDYRKPQNPLPSCTPQLGSSVEVCYLYGKSNCPKTCDYAQNDTRTKTKNC